MTAEMAGMIKEIWEWQKGHGNDGKGAGMTSSQNFITIF
jgi:hypothetical protein